jgi:hypothetical protein
LSSVEPLLSRGAWIEAGRLVLPRFSRYLFSDP